MKLVAKLAVAFVLLSVAAPAQAQNRALENRIAGYYEQYLKRSARRSEVRTWVAAIREGKIVVTDIGAQILASKEYFDRVNSQPRRFVWSLYRDVLGRRPTSAEADSWAQQYVNLQGDRLRMVRIYLSAAQRELDARWMEKRERDRDRPNEPRQTPRNW